MFGEQRAGLAGRGIERQNPAVLIIRRPRDHHRLGALLVPHGRLKLHFAIRSGRHRPTSLRRSRRRESRRAAVLRIADVGAAGNILRIRRLGDVVRHVIGLRAVARFVDHRDHAFLVRAQLQAIDGLPRLQAGTAFADAPSCAWLRSLRAAWRAPARFRAAPFPVSSETPGYRCPCSARLGAAVVRRRRVRRAHRLRRAVSRGRRRRCRGGRSRSSARSCRCRATSRTDCRRA